MFFEASGVINLRFFLLDCLWYWSARVSYSLSRKFLECFIVQSSFFCRLALGKLIIVQTIAPISEAMPPLKFSAFQFNINSIMIVLKQRETESQKRFLFTLSHIFSPLGTNFPFFLSFFDKIIIIYKSLNFTKNENLPI